MSATSTPPTRPAMGRPGQVHARGNTSVFRLEGPSHSFDPRIEAVREDLADVDMAHRYFAPHYAAAVPRSCIVPATPMRSAPEDDAPLVSELLFGEGFALLDVTGEWAWGYSIHDHCVAYVRAADLSERRAPAYRLTRDTAATRPDGAAMDLPVGALIAGREDGAQILGDCCSVPLDAAVRANDRSDDPVAIAEALVDAPYREGGRTRQGIDSAALVQCVLGHAGIDAPRETDLQFAQLNGDVATGGPYQRGDIIFLVDHAGIMADGNTILHASVADGRVVREPLASLKQRLEDEGHAPAIIGVKRLIAA